MEQAYTVQQLAKAWGIDEEAVRRRIQRGTLEAERVEMAGGTWRWQIMLAPDEVERQHEEIERRQQSRSKFATQEEEIDDALRIIQEQVSRLAGIKRRRYTGAAHPPLEDLHLDLLSLAINTMRSLGNEVKALREELERLHTE